MAHPSCAGKTPSQRARPHYPPAYLAALPPPPPTHGAAASLASAVAALTGTAAAVLAWRAGPEGATAARLFATAALAPPL